MCAPALLSTGRPVEIVPAVPRDFEQVRHFYEQLGDASTYFRFFGIRRALPDSELRDVVSHDLNHHVTLLAKIDDEVIGIGEYIVAPSADEAEVAFAVCDAHHHEGVATLLLEGLTRIARNAGLRRLTAITLPSNHDMRLVFRTIGLRHESVFDDDGMHYVLHLDDLDTLDERANERRSIAAQARSDRVAVQPSTDAVAGEVLFSHPDSHHRATP